MRMGSILMELDMALFLAVFGVCLAVGLASWSMHRDKVVAALYLAMLPRGSCGARRLRGGAPAGAARVYSIMGEGRSLPAGSRFWSASTGVFETHPGGGTVDCSCNSLKVETNSFVVRLGAARVCGNETGEPAAD